MFSYRDLLIPEPIPAAFTQQTTERLPSNCRRIESFFQLFHYCVNNIPKDITNDNTNKPSKYKYIFQMVLKICLELKITTTLLVPTDWYSKNLAGYS